jgi:hypothetical protein
MEEHTFTSTILSVLEKDFGKLAPSLLEQSSLLTYLNIKTRSASRGSKSRSAFANHYALYVLIEDYVQKGFHNRDDYHQYEGAKFSDLLQRQRELPFGEKLQNHALNHRLNEEFKKYFPTSPHIPIIRNVETNRYWINQYLLIIDLADKRFNIANSILTIIEAYISVKRGSFEQFIADSLKIQQLSSQNSSEVIEYIEALLTPQIDARIFEIVSYAILKTYYRTKSIYWGWELDSIQQDYLVLYKTGRTNANDGGIDFVMKPLGRFFQVTETTDVKKYFLDIDKTEHYPLTFVVKSKASIDELRTKIEEQARRIYPVEQIIQKYMSAIEEIINIPVLLSYLRWCIEEGMLNSVIREIIVHSKIEFNMPSG